VTRVRLWLKIEGTFWICSLSPPVKIREDMGETSESIMRARLVDSATDILLMGRSLAAWKIQDPLATKGQQQNRRPPTYVGRPTNMQFKGGVLEKHIESKHDTTCRYSNTTLFAREVYDVNQTFYYCSAHCHAHFGVVVANQLLADCLCTANFGKGAIISFREHGSQVATSNGARTTCVAVRYQRTMRASV